LITLKELADKVNGKLIGDDSIAISTVDDLKSASNKSIAFAFLPNYKKEISSSSAAAFVVTSDEDLKDNPGIVVENPYLAMITILDFLIIDLFLYLIFPSILNYMILSKNRITFTLELFQLLSKT